MSDPHEFPPPEDGDKTVLMPSPGGRTRGGAAARPVPPIFPEDSPSAQPADDRSATKGLIGAGSNPFLRAATGLLALISHMRTARGHHDVPLLRRRMITAMRRLESDLRQDGLGQEDIRKAQYAVCALSDETVLSTPWGFQSQWNTEPLQITLFGKGFSGEFFYDILREALRYPSGTIDLLELYYVCLSLGYKGRYGRERADAQALDDLKVEVYRTIIRERGEPINDLSPRWRGATDRRPVIARYVAWWTVPIVVVALLIGAYSWLSFDLNRDSDRVFTRLSKLSVPTPLPSPEPLPEPQSRQPPQELVTTWVDGIRLTLRPEIDRELLAVEEFAGTGRIVLFNRGLFPSGQAEVGDAFKPVIEKIGQVLAQNDPPGPYVVSGHTDNVPIRTLRFPSNYHLSEARAQAVAKILAQHLPDPTRLRPEGRADKEPIASNRSPEGQALNRRVQIEVPLPVTGRGAGITTQ